MRLVQIAVASACLAALGSVGLAQACLDASVKYAHERKTFGEEIGRHQLVKQMLAKMEQGIVAGRLLVWRAGWKKNRGERNTRETSLAKWFCTDHAVASAMDAIQPLPPHGCDGEDGRNRIIDRGPPAGGGPAERASSDG